MIRRADLETDDSDHHCVVCVIAIDRSGGDHAVQTHGARRLGRRTADDTAFTGAEVTIRPARA